MSRVLIMLGVPHTGIEDQALRLAQAAGGVYLGDLQLSMVDKVGHLPELYALAQTPQHEPLYQALRQHLPSAAGNPAAYLAAHADWSIAELQRALLAAIDAPLVTITDSSAGFRIHQVERWFARLPDADYLHVTTSVARFIDAAQLHYRGKLYVPPDYRDHNLFNSAPVMKPELAWYQVNATLARAMSDAWQLRSARVDIDTLASMTVAEVLDRIGVGGAPQWPHAEPRATAMAPTLNQLALSLGYRATT